MDCEPARERYLEAIVGGHRPTDDVANHVASCPPCRDELDGLTAAWNALGALPPREPSPEIARRLRRRIRWEAIREAVGSLERWQQAALSGGVGIVVSILLALVVPYDTAVAFCRTAMSGVLPAPLTYLLAGALYGLVPMALGSLVPRRRTAVPRGVPALEASLVFAVAVVPYAVLLCAEFPPALLAGFLGGIIGGAVMGGTVGSWLITRRFA